MNEQRWGQRQIDQTTLDTARIERWGAETTGWLQSVLDDAPHSAQSRSRWYPRLRLVATAVWTLDFENWLLRAAANELSDEERAALHRRHKWWHQQEARRAVNWPTLAPDRIARVSELELAAREALAWAHDRLAEGQEPCLSEWWDSCDSDFLEYVMWLADHTKTVVPRRTIIRLSTV